MTLNINRTIPSTVNLQYCIIFDGGLNSMFIRFVRGIMVGWTRGLKRESRWIRFTCGRSRWIRFTCGRSRWIRFTCSRGGWGGGNWG